MEDNYGYSDESNFGMGEGVDGLGAVKINLKKIARKTVKSVIKPAITTVKEAVLSTPAGSAAKQTVEAIKSSVKKKEIITKAGESVLPPMTVQAPEVFEPAQTYEKEKIFGLPKNYIYIGGGLLAALLILPKIFGSAGAVVLNPGKRR